MGVSHALIFLIVPVAIAQQPLAPGTGTQSPFLPVPPAATDDLQFAAQLPDFETKDISGQTWRSGDLRGKFTLIYIWNTFEARATDTLDPHARESFHGLPDLLEVQRFYDEMRNTKNVQVLTFCRDYDYTHAHDYMRKKKYTFPVIADWVLINKLFPGAGGQPPYWLVNPEGRVSYPFRSWSLGRLLFALEGAAVRN